MENSNRILRAVDELAVSLGRSSTLRPNGTGVGGLAFTYDEVTAIDNFRRAVLRLAAEDLRSEGEAAAELGDWDTHRGVLDAADRIDPEVSN